MTPTQLAELIQRTAGSASVDERSGLAVLQAPMADAALRQAWIELRRAPPAFLEAVSIHDVVTQEPLDDVASPDAATRFRITVRKSTASGELRLFFARSAAASADAWTDVDVVQVAEMAPDQSFATFRSRVQLWTLDAPAPYAPSEPLPDPRSLVRDFTPGALAVPTDLRPWLLRTAPKDAGGAYRTWQAMACRKLVVSLADHVSGDPAAPSYHFSGPPSCDVPLSEPEAMMLFDRLTEGAIWAFAEGARDADTRHLLLANEWARSYRRGAPAALGDGALVSAKAAYAAYVKSGSRETLKAIADLRKAVVEESQKAAQRAQDLAGSLWRDLAVAAVPFVLKLMPDSAKVANRWIAGGMAAVAMLFLIYSFSVQVYINQRYFKHQRKARGVWQQSLNSVLTPGEIQEFSETPIELSVDDYGRVRASVGVVYAVLVIVLALFAAYNFTAAPAPLAPARSQPGAGTPAGPPASNGATAASDPAKAAGSAPSIAAKAAASNSAGNAAGSH